MIQQPNTASEQLRGVIKGKETDTRPIVRKIICRYGRGCTHMNDPSHRERFWHPPLPLLSEDQLRTHYICNECGIATTSLADLQLHLKMKTAWSNKSLVGCRISCLLDFKEWHEGYVTMFHKSGKHCVEFRAICEKRWLNMKKVAFYTVERPLYNASSFSEYKEDELFDNNNNTINNGNVSTNEDKWVYAEDISIDYAFAQSVLYKVYGGTVQETGHKTKGHVCVTDSDRDNAKNNKGSLLYGELLPRGANKAFGVRHLHCSDAKVLFDLGMGAGKVAVQAFVQFRNLEYVYGVELSVGRYCLAEDAVLRMVLLLGAELFTVEVVPGQSIRVTERVPETTTIQKKENGEERDMMGTSDLSGAFGALGQVVAASSQGLAHLMSATSPRAESKSEYDHHQGMEGMGSRKNNHDTVPISTTSKGRVLHLVCGNMFDHVKNIGIADIVMLETDIPADNLPDLNDLLAGMKEGSRTLTYLDLRKVWTTSSSPTTSAMPFPFRQLEQNKQLSDRFPTSWSVQRGHHFFLWCKDTNSGSNNNGVPKTSSSNTTNYIAGIDPSSLFYGFRPSASSAKSNGNNAGNAANITSNAENSLTLKQLEDELWRRHTNTPTGIMMTGGIGIQQLQQQQHRNQTTGHAIVGGRNVLGSYNTPPYNPTSSGNGQRMNHPVGNAAGSGLTYAQTNTNNPSFSSQSNVSVPQNSGRQRPSNHTTKNANLSYNGSNNSTRCLPLSFSFRSLLFGSNVTRDGNGNNVSMNRKKHHSGGRKGDREDNNGSHSSPVSRGNIYDNSTTAAATPTFVDRDRVIPLNADGTRSRAPVEPQPYGLLSRAVNSNTNNNTTSHSHGGSNTSPRATATSSSFHTRKGGNDDPGIVMVHQNILVDHRHNHQHPDNDNDDDDDDELDHSGKEAWSMDTVPAPTSTRYRVPNTPRTQNNNNNNTSGGGDGWIVATGNNTSSLPSSSLVVGNDVMSRHQLVSQQSPQLPTQAPVLSQLSQGSDAWYNLGCTIERLAFPLVSSNASGSPRSNTGTVNASQGHVHGGFTSVSVKQVHVDDDDDNDDVGNSSGDEDVNEHDFDVDGGGENPPSSSMLINQLHHHAHSPGFFLDHSSSHPLTLGRGGGVGHVWNNGSSTGHANGVSSSSSPTILLRPQPPSQPRTLPTTSPPSSSTSLAHHTRSGGGVRGALSLENNSSMPLDVEDHEEGMIQVLPISSSPSGRQNNNSNSPFLPGGNFYNGPGMASPHVAGGGADAVPGIDNSRSEYRSNQSNGNGSSQNNSSSNNHNNHSSKGGNQIVTNSGRVSKNNNNNNNNSKSPSTQTHSNQSVSKGQRQQQQQQQQQPLEDPAGCLIQ